MVRRELLTRAQANEIRREAFGAASQLNSDPNRLNLIGATETYSIDDIISTTESILDDYQNGDATPMTRPQRRAARAAADALVQAEESESSP